MGAVPFRAMLVAVLLTSATLFAQNGLPALPSPATRDVQAEPELDFSVWLTNLVTEARTRGFSDQVLAQTLSGLEPLPRVIQADRNQAELNPGFARYRLR